MPLSRPALLGLIALLAVLSIGAIAAYVHERDKRSSVEIRLDQNGIRIDGR